MLSREKIISRRNFELIWIKKNSDGNNFMSQNWNFEIFRNIWLDIIYRWRFKKNFSFCKFMFSNRIDIPENVNGSGPRRSTKCNFTEISQCFHFQFNGIAFHFELFSLSNCVELKSLNHHFLPNRQNLQNWFWREWVEIAYCHETENYCIKFDKIPVEYSQLLIPGNEILKLVECFSFLFPSFISFNGYEHFCAFVCNLLLTQGGLFKTFSSKVATCVELKI